MQDGGIVIGGRPVVVAAAVLALAFGACRRDAAGTEADGPASRAAPAGGKAVYRGPLLEMTGDETQPVRVWNPAGKRVLDPYYAFERKGLALVGREASLRLEGGRFFSAGAEEYLGGGLRNGGAMTLAAYVRPATATQKGAGCIVGYGPAKADLLFALMQDRDALTFRIGRTKPTTVALFALTSAKPCHVVVTVAPKGIVVYRDGARVGGRPGPGTDLTTWRDGMLILGADAEGRRPWRGRLERVTLYNTALSPAEAKALATSVREEIGDREPVPRIELTGTLRARSKYPMPWDRGFTYRDVLCVCEYEVNTVIRGEFEGRRIRVAEWVYVDRIFVTNSRNKIGATRRLTVEPLDVNPQLSTIQRADTLDLDIDALVYYDLSPLEALPPSKQPKPKKEK